MTTMPRAALKLHPDCRSGAVRSIEVEIARPAPSRLWLRYLLVGRIADLVVPPAAPSRRADELWRHTCFEAFLRGPAGEGYAELNLAPSSEWAAYRFEGYRQGMQAQEVAAPDIAAAANGDRLELSATFDLPGAEYLPADAPWRLGLSAVVEERGGRVSYWAAAHPPGRPDFHHPDCFALILPAPVGT